MLIKYIGKKFPKGKDNHKRNYGLFSCDKCGIEKEKIMQTKDENDYLCNSCSKKTHGMYGSKLYVIWASMISRCHCKGNSQYKFYGEKGVIVCDEWRNNFKCFYDWAMSNGYKEGLTIDKDIICEKEKIQPKIYSPKTCIWITKIENTLESKSRKSKKIGQYTKEGVFLNEFKSVLNASKITGIAQSGINSVTLGHRKTAGGYCWKDLS